MRVWLIIQGEKQGPFQVAEVVERIRCGELDATIHTWHDGMQAWKPLGELDSFRHEFEPREEGENDDSAPFPQPPAFPARNPSLTPAQTLLPAQLWRRWLARTFDMLLWLSFCFGVCAAMGWPLKEWILSSGFVVVAMPLWIPLEALMLNTLGGTPGKLLLGLRVAAADGSKLKVGTAIVRSARCFFMGMGAFYPVVMIFCQAFCWWITRKKGIALWDAPQQLQVSYRPLAWWRWPVTIFVFFMATNILSLPATPVMIEVLRSQSPNHPFIRVLSP